MGQTLSAPATAKRSESGGDAKYLFGVSEMQGWRINMEDAHTTVLKLDDSEQYNTFFAVYDGHGGSTVAKYSGEHVHRRLVTERDYLEGNWEEALRKTFLGIDDDIRAEPTFFRDPSGCTAVAALITHDKKIYVANAGDSRSIISVKGEAKPLSFDHKPQNEVESTRIRNAGGYIEYGRVNGNLALSRAIGDFEFKKNPSIGPEKQVITADPDVLEHTLTDEDEFLVLACDGIWDCLTSQQVVDIIRLKVAEGKELAEICEFFCDHCLAPDTTSGAGVGCDNMTILIVAILNGRTKEEWYEWVKSRVEQRYGYATPDAVPEIYSPTRLNAYRARRQAYEQRGVDPNRYDPPMNGFSGITTWRPGPFGGLARSMLGSGISFHPSQGLADGDGPLRFVTDDSDEDDSGDEFGGEREPHSYISAFGQRLLGSVDVTRTLRAQLEELEDDDDLGARPRKQFRDLDSYNHDPDSPPSFDDYEEEMDPFNHAKITPLELGGTSSEQGPGSGSHAGINGETPSPQSIPKVDGDTASHAQFESIAESTKTVHMAKSDELVVDSNEDPAMTV